MIFYFLFSIVFIAELIITAAIMSQLLNADKFIKDADSLISDVKPILKEILEITRKISERILENAPILVKKVEKVISNFFVEQIKSLLGVIVFHLVRIEVEKHV